MPPAVATPFDFVRPAGKVASGSWPITCRKNHSFEGCAEFGFGHMLTL
jgi:hypothetical protein